MEINWDRFVVLLLPIRKRKATVFSFIKCILAPIRYLHNVLNSFKTEVNYKLGHTGQVWSIEAVLNDAFDIVERRIYYSDAGGDVVTLLHRDSDEEPLILNDDANGIFLLHNDSAYNGGSYNFIINIPYQFIDADMYRLRALVDYYKLDGLRYDIVVK